MDNGMYFSSVQAAGKSDPCTGSWTMMHGTSGNIQTVASQDRQYSASALLLCALDFIATPHLAGDIHETWPGRAASHNDHYRIDTAKLVISGTSLT